MDRDFNVDDILTDIKRKKKREREGAEQAGEQARETPRLRPVPKYARAPKYQPQTKSYFEEEEDEDELIPVREDGYNEILREERLKDLREKRPVSREDRQRFKSFGSDRRADPAGTEFRPRRERISKDLGIEKVWDQRASSPKQGFGDFLPDARQPERQAHKDFSSGFQGGFARPASQSPEPRAEGVRVRENRPPSGFQGGFPRKEATEKGTPGTGDGLADWKDFGKEREEKQRFVLDIPSAVRQDMEGVDARTRVNIPLSQTNPDIDGKAAWAEDGPDPELAQAGAVYRMQRGPVARRREEQARQEEEEYSPGNLSEYNGPNDRIEVARDLARMRVSLTARTLIIGLISIALFYLAQSLTRPLALPAFLDYHENMRIFVAVNFAFLVAAALLCYVTVGGGLLSLLGMKASADAPAALAVLGVSAQGIAYLMNPEQVAPGSTNLYFPVAALVLLMNSIGKISVVTRIQNNFRLVSSDLPKYGIIPLAHNGLARDMADLDEIREPRVLHGVRADLLSNFLSISHGNQYDESVNRIVVPVYLLASFLISGITYLFQEDIFTAVSAFCAGVCICATFSATFVENLPLSILSRRLVRIGGMVSSSKAVGDMGEVDSVILSDRDLFPGSCVQLHEIKSFRDSRIDEAILDAASVLYSCQGVLSDIFMEMLGGKVSMLKPVDNLVYEDLMGLSAWVDGKRVLIGNRDLMKNHGVYVPDQEARKLESYYSADNLGIVYLSNSGELTAIFVISYNPDASIADQLYYLESKGIMLGIYSTDSNLTEKKIEDIYSIQADSVRVMPAKWHEEYRKLTERRTKVSAKMAYTGGCVAMLAAVNGAVKARSAVAIGTILQIINVILGYALVAFLAFVAGSLSTLTVPAVILFQGFWLLAIILLQKFKKL